MALAIKKYVPAREYRYFRKRDNGLRRFIFTRVDNSATRVNGVRLISNGFTSKFTSDKTTLSIKTPLPLREREGAA
jgi:hypothetical protein